MLSFTTLFVAASAVLGAIAAPTATTPEDVSRVRKRNTPNETGTSGGFYYQFWSEAGGSVDYENGPGGNYHVTWSAVTDFTSGKGWSTAAPRNISYEGTFVPGSNSYLAVYTWSQQGETYILENFGTYNPGSCCGKHQGTITSDGGTYDVWLVDRGNNYIQYWSIRQEKRTSGVVTTGNHYNWYIAHGLTHNPNSAAAYQILSTEGYESTGSSNMTVGEVSGDSAPVSSSAPASSTKATTAAPSSVATSTAAAAPTSTSSSTSGAVAHYAQCGGQGWKGATTCVAPYTCTASGAYYSQCL
ncbi:hypothetical protein LTR91_003273 [Friedmanniomyces endolithicus]|uniref:endo-1,4-beta-xylanase n=1 Tax=Friedmanniomyces endolithicus TaxID=329885 RepID=A0AAN6KXZ3_9PEZI|nr:hypothetical protein LTR94_002654 [Friedmanniomyces endolithicus]KAK0787566.1 hypothetical protein LTR75_012852 [Friedmanniomyces endolithicus]KAK0812453.1 hypothetical protein LTR59_001413 [Friedmanniomyces endolithicus]KAK0812679.1 hypothetical protein LTR38_003296 [Friedmanniomyces endolithicus]KAK0831940.1 hypothetical protein LTR03_015324 [Friedmanniomyces endolithicus]